MKRIVPLLLAVVVLGGCGDRTLPSVSATAKADGVVISAGDTFDGPFTLTCDIAMEDRSSTTVTTRLDTRTVDLSNGVLVGPGLHVLEVTATVSSGLSSSYIVDFSVVDPDAPLRAEGVVNVKTTDTHHEVLVHVRDHGGADPTQWMLTGILGTRPTESYSLPSYRFAEGDGILDDPDEAVFEDGQWKLRFLIPRSEVPEQPSEYFLTGFVHGVPIAGSFRVDTGPSS